MARPGRHWYGRSLGSRWAVEVGMTPPMIERVFYSVKGDVSPLLNELQDDLRDDSPRHHEDQAVDAALHLRHLPLQAAQPLFGGRPELGRGDAGPPVAPLITLRAESGEGAFEGGGHGGSTAGVLGDHPPKSKRVMTGGP